MMSYEAKELELWIMNNEQLYNGMVVSVEKALARRKYRGDYDSKKAVKAFRNVADEAARRYGKEAYGKYGIPPEFPPKVRDEVAEEMLRDFEIGFVNGDFEEYKQKYLR